MAQSNYLMEMPSRERFEKLLREWANPSPDPIQEALRAWALAEQEHQKEKSNPARNVQTGAAVYNAFLVLRKTLNLE